MPQDTHLELVHDEGAALQPASAQASADSSVLRSQAAELARNLAWLPGVRESSFISERCRAVTATLRTVLVPFRAPLPEKRPVSDDFRWLHDNVRLVDMELHGLGDAIKPLRKVPHVHTPGGTIVPRPTVIAQGFLAAVQYEFTEQAFSAYVEAFQETTTLSMKELAALISTLKLSLIEEIAVRAARVLAHAEGSHNVGVCIRSLRDVAQTSWKDVLEALILFDRVLRNDPSGAYSRMDFESRELYRKRVVRISKHSEFTEMQVANEALALAREAQRDNYDDPRLALRRSHVGYYLVDEGVAVLQRRAGFRPKFSWRTQTLLRSHPDEFYLPGIEILTFAIMSVAVLLLTNPYSSPGLILLAMLALLLPSSQSAIQVMNYLTTSLLRPQIIPKLDFSEGTPDDCATLVAVPTLLLNEQQVRRLVEDLEVRFLGNHDRNLFFALLSDLPDSSESPREDSALIGLCSDLIRELNQKYASQNGTFLLLHRHRVYNPSERVWMGWERKRGKLMDLNKLLRNQHDSFPVKVGDLSVLSRVRFVITLDSDTELPRGSAHRMIGALGHPLNQAVIDREKNVVVAGYGILQPRVGVSVQSAVRSRLAAIYSGETGFDIYTRAVSDVYQDLYGEAIFAGKGIYEVDTLHQVLDRRFPRNALLSHDLIEGAYARAGLASDIEIIEDYPSHYSAYNRRKHRWLRGDWQITHWLLPNVPDESGRRVPNPMSIISQWKILDNLRRSLVEPATLLLLVLGWIALPGAPRYWTLATIAILFVPTWCRFLFELIRSALERKSVIARDALGALWTANVNVFLTLTFLAHQMLVSLDAVVRTLVRRLVTGQRLLQWETAAEAELGGNRRTPLDIYLDWTPALALGLGLLVWFVRRNAIWPALPVLLLWACSKMISRWLNRPPTARHNEVSRRDRLFLRRAALSTWRYFAEFATPEHHWLIPDNVQQEPACVAGRVSPTNLGFLLNARQVACEFGYLTVPEYAEETLRTLATMAILKRHRGHLLNWYDTHTLQPLTPEFVSSVDSGNLVTSLWTLQQGSLERLHRPLLEQSSAEGLLDYLRMLLGFRAFPRRRFATLERELTGDKWLDALLNIPESTFEQVRVPAKHVSETQWYADQSRIRFTNIKQTVRFLMPWLLPEFSALRDDTALKLKAADRLPLEQVPDFIDRLTVRLQLSAPASNGGTNRSAHQELMALLPEARAQVVRLIHDLRKVAGDAGKFAGEMDFRFLLDRRRKLLSVGYDAGAQQLNAACYDLLASESRIAAFVAIAKDDIPQESWFLLGRVHTMSHGHPVLLSWTGTMFEYLMPALWMHSYPDTLLERTRSAAVYAQQVYTARKRIPWGISESAYSKRDEAGNYQYQAFGLPHLALREQEGDALVISPYSTFLALHVDSVGGLKNLRKMASKGWFGPYGFYEAADFTPPQRSWRHNHEVVRCWMAHHQGMSLVSTANFLLDGVVQRWFHSHPRVQATELLLHEKPLAHLRTVRSGYGTAAA